MKKLLIISPHDIFPPQNGGERRIYLLAKKLATTNKTYFVGPKLRNKNAIDFPIEVIEAFENKSKKKLLNFNLIKEINNILKENKDIEIQLEFIWQGINLILSGVSYTLDAHNVEFLRFKRIGFKWWPLIYLYERLVCKRAKKIICVSEVDKKYLVKYFKINPTKIEIIENPVDTSIFYPDNKNNKKIRKELGIKNKEKFILFFGQLDYRPNIEALEIIKEEIIPRLDKSEIKYKLVICGKGDGNGLLKRYKNKNLILKGFVDRIQDYINASDIIIAPLKSGSGTRIKILEALACKKRVVSTSIGAEGIKKNKLLEIEDDWEKFVEKM